MMLLEHDAKELLASFSINLPNGVLVDQSSALPDFPAPWMVKAQVPTGGRAKDGGVALVRNEEECERELSRLLGATICGHSVRYCRIEEVSSGHECYISLMLNPANGALTILLSLMGGIDIETNAQKEELIRKETAFTQVAAYAALEEITKDLLPYLKTALRSAGRRLCDAFFGLELILAEINPLFVREDGDWTAADAKIVIDESSLLRQKSILALLYERSEIYSNSIFKLEHGFDFLVLDREGEVGLLTTGAGLSMQLLDELSGADCRPFNFCDIRTGQFRGSSERMVRALEWMASGEKIKVILINFFAGVTDLSELAPLILNALEKTPSLRVPVVIRLVGNQVEKARTIIESSERELTVHTDLDIALSRVRELAAPAPNESLEESSL